MGDTIGPSRRSNARARELRAAIDLTTTWPGNVRLIKAARDAVEEIERLEARVAELERRK